MAFNIPILVVLIICGVGFPILSLIAAIIYYCHYTSPEDKGRAWLPKIVFHLAFVLGIMSVLLMPLDVANARFLQDATFQFALGIIWQVFYGLVIVTVLLIIPFTIAYYEAEDTDYIGLKGVIRQAIWGSVGTACCAVICGIIFGLTYWWMGYAVIKFTYIQRSSYAATPQAALEIALVTDAFSKESNYQVLVSIVVFLIGYLSFFGWIALVICGGCGMSALPISSMKAIFTRPRTIKSNEFVELKRQVQTTAEKLIEMGEKLAEAQDGDRFGTKTRKAFIMFKNAASHLERDWEVIQKRYYKGGGSLIFSIIQTIYGFIAAVVTLIWVVHIVLYLFIPPEYFQFGLLNIVFTYADEATAQFPIIGAILFTLFSFHIIFAVLAGLDVVSRRFSFINAYTLHPGNTLMNSMLVNVAVFLTCCVTATQFSARVFAGYVKQTMLEAIFGGAINSLYFIGAFFYNVHYAFVGAIILGIPLAILDAVCTPKTEAEEEVNEAIKALQGVLK